ncbi:sulfatase-like hydrolase/transferase [Caulobacter sp. 1776]|uniref:sulfatase-like hydrolase/transferase n=1 Tax=Caulobacter sp. 1776 TaxID=3156420 RepID=UPI003390BDD7
MNMKALWLIGAAALALAAPSFAGEVKGRVVGPDGAAVAGAKVVVNDLLRGDTTGRDGGFDLPRLPAGQYDVLVTAMGLASQQRTVTIPETGAATLDFRLGPDTALTKAAAMNAEPAADHSAQKQAYLASVKPVTGHRPNIVVLLFDDLGYGDLSSYGNRLIKTPNIDALASRGLKLTQFYSGSPVCTPSRAALLTGRYPTRSRAANHVFFPTDNPMARIRRSAGYANAIPADEILLPEVLSRAGYRTGAFGKWHLGDTPGHRPTDLGFQTYFGVLYSNDMTPLPIYRGEAVDTPPDKTDQHTLTERFTDEAIGFMRANAGQPFFAYVPFTAPHLPHYPNPKHQGVSEGGVYGDVVEDLDANVGRIMKAIDELGIADDTIVIVTSDNGGDQGGSVGDLRGRKGETYEGGMRVPGFVIWPGKTKPGSVSDAMAMNIDLFPTLLAMLGVPSPTDRILDGRDMTSMLSGGPSPHDYLYYVTAYSGEFQAVRDADFKYRTVISEKWPLAPTGTAAPYGARPALYNLSGDNESHDVSLKHPDEAKKLAERLAAFRADAERNPRGWASANASSQETR